MSKKKLVFILCIGFLLILLGGILYKPVLQDSSPSKSFSLLTNSPTPTVQPTNEPETKTTVTRIIDGDTIELEDGTRVRLLGIDTPESGQCASGEATATTSELVLNKNVKLETDVQLKDRYGRLLAHIFIDGVHVNEELVKAGWATTLTIPPNVKYVDKLLKAQQDARAAKLGIWADDPCPEHVSNPPNPSAPTSSDCLIKGNISSSGEKIYHIQGQRYYEKTKIEENKGERWFCTEEEAIQAGWRKSKI